MRLSLRLGLGLSFLLGCAEAPASSPPPSSAANANAGATSPEATAAAAPSVPDAIKAPADQVVLLKAKAKGSQIYECKPKADNPMAFGWSLKAPDAELFDDAGKPLGKHYGGPTWEATDGSKVVAQKKAQVDAPDAAAIPWLILETKSAQGEGALKGVQTIQRIDTAGGKAPADGCDAAHAGTEVRVPYTATYVFSGKR
jgi:hypothetical protein